MERVAMIKSFADQGTEDIYNGVQSKKVAKLPTEIIRRARLLLHTINSVNNLNALKIPPGNRLESLKGNLFGFYSVRINDQWRIIFKFNNGDFFDVKIDDYH